MSENEPHGGDFVSAAWKRTYRTTGLALGIMFGAVGMLFLLRPALVVLFFNGFGQRWGMAESPLPGASLYLALAAAYMYAVTALALGMYFHPEERVYAVLLIQAKSASAVLSLVLCFISGAQLILVLNAVVDGSIALGVSHLEFRGRRKQG